MISTNFNTYTNILETKFTEFVTLKEVVDYIRVTKNNQEYPRHLTIMTDAKFAIFDFSIHDVETIISENEQSLEKYDSITDAIVVVDPKNTAISILYKDFAKNPKYNFNVFSTTHSAEAWLLNN
tara:strand:- start:30231 stop:30602 length:372 start_codon:yes stop_codon:yes gene_type:complete